MNMNSYYCVLVTILISCTARINAQVALEQNLNGSTILDHEHTNESDVDYSYPNVLSVRFHLLHRQIPKLLTKISLAEMECPVKECLISLLDIVDAIQLGTYENSDIANAIEKLYITGRDAYNMFLIYNVNATSIYNLLTTAGTTFSEIYKNFVDSLHDPQNEIPQILAKVNVSVLDFMNAQAYGNDSTKLEVLATGNYSYENILSVLQSINKTGIDLVKTLPLNTIAKNLRNFHPIVFRNFVKNLGLTSSSLLDFYNSLNATSINFIAYPGFSSILTEFEAYLNPEEVVATVISNTTLVTSNKAKSLITYQTENTDFVRNYSYFQAENIENPLIHYHIKNVLLKNNEYKGEDIAFVEVYNAYRDNFTEIAKTYNATRFFNCTYVTRLPFGEVYAEEFPVVDFRNGHFITVVKTNMTLYNIGSPLFCQNRLVAIATQDSPTEILLTTFMKKNSGPSLPPGQQPPLLPGNATTPSPGTSKPGAAATNYVNVVLVLVLCICSVLIFE